MKPIYRSIAITLFAAASTVAFAQAGTGGNTVSRGDRDPFGATMNTPRSGTIGQPGFGQNAVGRAMPRSGHAQVTPVPEPSQWALMIAGLALVGYMVGKNRKK